MLTSRSTKTRLPTNQEKQLMYFKNYTITHKIPFTNYADFLSSFFVSIDTSNENPEKSHTTNTTKHIPFGHVIINSNGESTKPPV